MGLGSKFTDCCTFLLNPNLILFRSEMVKSFSKEAKVIILDISPVPPELEKRKKLFRSKQTSLTQQFLEFIITSLTLQTLKRSK